MRRVDTLKGFTLVLVMTVMMLIAIVNAYAASTSPNPSLIIKMAPGLTAEEQAAVIARNGGVETAVLPTLRMHVISVQTGDPAAVLSSYRLDPQVERAEQNLTRKSETLPSDASYGVQWALPKIGWDAVFGATMTAGFAKVAVLDTGIDASHPDLDGNVTAGISMLDNSNGLSDANGHGTQLGGIVAAMTDNGLGIAGVALSGVKVMPVTVLDAGGVGLDSDIIAGIIWAADHGADVILMGFSNPDFSQNLQDAIDYAWSKGAVLVAATGNDGISTPTFPAGDRGVIGVSATTQSDTLAFGSNFGQDTFLAAPGSSIYTTTLSGEYTYISGTSASSAVVAGVAALLKAVDPSLTNGVIVGRLARSADAIGADGDPENQRRYGNGRVNMARALADTGTDAVEPSGATPVGPGGPYVGPYTAAAQISSVKVGPQTGSLTYGTHGTVTYDLTVDAQGNGNVTLDVANLPAGATFAPATFERCNNGCTITLSVATLDTTPPGSTDFIVNATLGTAGTKSGTGTLKIDKARATVTLGNLSATYDGAPKSATATTNPAGLRVDVTYDGSPTAPTNAGTYAVTATVNANEPYYAGNSSGTLTIDKAAATVTLDNLTQTYTGGALTPGVTTVPAGLTVNWSNAPQTNAGSYDVTASVNDANYQGSASGTLVINKAAATVSLDNLTQTYNGSALKPVATTSPAGLKIDWTNAPQTNAGSYDVTASVNDANYQGSASGTLVINKAAATVSLGSTTQTYTGGALTPSATTTPAGLGIDWTNAPQTNAGSYNVTATVNDPSYQGSASCAFVINKAPATVSLSNMTQTYNGGALFPTATTAPPGLGITWTNAPQTGAGSYQVTATVNNPNYQGSLSGTFTVNKAPATVTFSNMTQTYTGRALAPTVTTTPPGLKVDLTNATQVSAGSYPVTATVNDANYTGSNSGTFTIDKAPATVTLGGLTQTYNGSPLTPTATTAPPGLDVIWNNAPQSNAGSYPVTATVSDPNYTGSTSGTFLIEKATAGVTLSGLTQTYNGSAQAPTVTTTPAGLHVEVTNAPQSAAGSYHVTATVVDSNYQGSTNGTFVIAKAMATVTLGNLTQTYNGSALTPTATTVPAGLSVTWSNASQTKAGSYSVTATVNDPNYQGSASDTFVINKASATVTLGNLTQTYNGGALTPAVTTVPAGLSVEWSNAPQTTVGSYSVTAAVNDPNYQGSAGGTFVINRATANIVLGGLSQTYNGSQLTPTATTVPAGLNVAWSNAPQTSAGSYQVTATINDPNYQGSTGGTFVIDKAAAGITLGSLTQTYSGSALRPTATTVPPGLTVDWSNAPQTAAGSYGVTATINDTNYQGSASDTFVIAKAAAQVNLGNLVQTYTGSALAPSVTTVPANLKVGFTNAAQTNAGSYPVTATVDDPNYEGTASATFTINQASAKVTLGSLTQTYNGSVLSPTVATVPAGLRIDWSNEPQSNAGSYPVTASVNDPNYQGSASGTFVINKAIAGVALGNLTQTYSGSALMPGAATTPPNLKIVWSDTAKTNAGSYPVTAAVDDANYQGSASGTFTINKATASVTLGDLTQPYTGTPLSPSAVTVPANLALNWTNAVHTTAGTYPVVATVSDPNYQGSANGTFNILSAVGMPTSIIVPPSNSTGTIYVYWGSSDLSGVTYHLEYSRDGSAWVAAYTGGTTNTVVTLTANGSYRFRVKATKDSYADSAYRESSLCSVTLACGTPTGITVAPSNTTGRIYLYWNSSDIAGATYVLESSMNGGEYSEVYRGPTTNTSVAVAVNGSYSFRVKAIKYGYADSGYRNSTPCAVALTCGVPPSVTVPATNSTGSIYIYWSSTDISGATYVLESSLNGGAYAQVYSGTASNTTVAVSGNGSYSFRVKAIKNGYAESGYRNSTACSVSLACSAPTSLNVPRTSTRSVYVYWGSSDVADATYTLQYSTDGSTWSTAYTGTATRSLAQVPAAGNYLFQVNASKEGYTSSGFTVSTNSCSVTM